MFNGMNNMNSFGSGGGFGGGANPFGGAGNIFGGNQFGGGAAGFNQFGAGANLFGQNNSFGANTFQRNFFQQRRTQQVEEEEEEEEIEEEIEDEIEEDDDEEETNKAVNPFSNSNSTPFPRLKQNNLNNPFGNLFSQFNKQNEESSEEEEDEEEKPKPKFKPKASQKPLLAAPKPIPIPVPIPQTPVPAPANARSSTAQTKKESAIIEKKESTIKERKDDRDDDYRPRRVARKIRETIIYEDDNDDDDDEYKLERGSSRRRRRSLKHDESSQTRTAVQQNQSQQNFVPGPVGNRDLRPTGGTGIDLPLAVPTTMKPSSEVNKPVVININPLVDAAVKGQKQHKSAFEKKERAYLQSQTYSRDPCQPPSCRERYLKPICLPVCSDNVSRQHLCRNRSYKIVSEKPIKASSSRLICLDTETNKKYQCVAKSSTQPIYYQKIVKQVSPPPPPQLHSQLEPSERIFKAALSSSMTTPPLPRLSQRRERINPVPVVKTGSPTFITIPEGHNIYNDISQSSSSKELAAATAARGDTASPVQIYTAPAGSQFSQNYAEKRSETEMSMGSVLSNLAPGRLPENVYAPLKSPLVKSATVQVLNERSVTGSSIASILSALAPGRIPDSLYFPPTAQQIEQQEVEQEQHYAVVSDVAAAAITASSADSETRQLATTPIQQSNVEVSQLAIVKSSQQTVTGSSLASILSALAPGRIPDSLFFKSPSSKVFNKPVRLPRTNSRVVVPVVKCQPAPVVTKDFCAMVNAALAKIPLNAPVHCYARAIESILNSSIFGNKYCNTKYRFEISPFTYSTDTTSRSGKSSEQLAILPLPQLPSSTSSSAKTLSNATLSLSDSKNLIIDAPPDLSMISIKIENI